MSTGTTLNGLVYPFGDDLVQSGDDRIRDLALAFDPAWTGLTFRTGYQNRAGNYGCAFRLRAGRLEFKGQLQKTSGSFSGSETFADLTPSYRPLFPVSMAVAQALSTTVVGRVDISTAGAVTVVVATGSTPSWIALDGCSIYVGAGS